MKAAERRPYANVHAMWRVVHLNQPLPLYCHKFPAGKPIISLFSGEWHLAYAYNLLVGKNCLSVGLPHLVRCC